ncbi:hypothetical protein [Pontibacterium sp.]|uniref:hypothetical protein n=1 Tax=Pontibacterium sp. TaxID=2036026 RepID=UPI0035672E07
MDQNPLVLFVQLIRHNYPLLFELLLQILSSSTFCFVTGSVGLMMVIIGGHNQRYANILDRSINGFCSIYLKTSIVLLLLFKLILLVSALVGLDGVWNEVVEFWSQHRAWLNPSAAYYLLITLIIILIGMIAFLCDQAEETSTGLIGAVLLAFVVFFGLPSEFDTNIRLYLFAGFCTVAILLIVSGSFDENAQRGWRR